MLDWQKASNLAEAPPYLQPQDQLVQNQLEEMRAFHEKESAKMLEDVRVFRNGEMERLALAGKALEKERRCQEDYEKTLERRAKWTSWFKKKQNEKP